MTNQVTCQADFHPSFRDGYYGEPYYQVFLFDRMIGEVWKQTDGRWRAKAFGTGFSQHICSRFIGDPMKTRKAAAYYLLVDNPTFAKR